jgi:tubulin-like protein CetZ
MRIIAIGLGGAGCRIVDSLYATDRKSSKIACIQALAVDVDETTLTQLKGMPDSAKLFFETFDPENPNTPGGTGPTATIDIAEIISRVNNFESSETDAIFICCGLGGSMADIVPHIITGLRSSLVEPIFGLVTLPCLAEGERRSAKAADDIDILSPLLDGMILFDNETWYKKTKERAAKHVKKEKGIAQMLGFGKEEPEISPELATYRLLNEGIVRRISLILKAGEFRADGGIDLAEVVLDSGEVLNTMKGMGFITIGYAVERLPSNPLAFLSYLKPAGIFNEESKKRASRIVELAKQAIYHEISTPCDMTSAHKALVLVAGPSHELSMQGFMTVRKWIDRSIRGLETRSGDYPVMNTKNVAIIIMLTGLENIPRVNEIREIREQGRSGQYRGMAGGTDRPSLPGEDLQSLRDDMIVLPKRMQKEDVPARASFTDAPVRQVSLPDENRERAETVPAQVSRHPPRVPVPATPQVRPPDAGMPPMHPREHAGVQPASAGSPGVQHRHAAPGSQDSPAGQKPSPRPVQQPVQQPMQQPVARRPAPVASSPAPGLSGMHTNEVARQKIEQELHRQRKMVITASQAKPNEVVAKPPAPPSRIIRQRPDPQPSASPAGMEERMEAPLVQKKTVIVRKKSPVPEQEEPVLTEEPVPEVPVIIRRSSAHLRVETVRPEPAQDVPDAEDDVAEPVVPTYPEDSEPEERTIAVKEPAFRAKDAIFSGKKVPEATPIKARDASLIHTNLKQKKSGDGVRDEEPYDATADPEDSAHNRQQGKRGKKRDDLSWI